MIVQHEDGRWGVLVPGHMTSACDCGLPHPHPTRYEMRPGGVCASVEGYSAAVIGSTISKEILAYLRAQEFNVNRPHEAIWMPREYGFGFFYLELVTP